MCQQVSCHTVARAWHEICCEGQSRNHAMMCLAWPMLICLKWGSQ
jgi:hypothetical protein